MSDPRVLSYHLRFPRAAEHIAEVRLELELPAGTSTLVLPVWSPGSYKIRDYPRWIRRMRLADDDRALAKTRKNAWQVELAEAGRVAVEYELYGFEFSVRTNHITERHAFLNGPATFLYVEDERDRPCEFSAELPASWSLALALPTTVEDGRTIYRCENYDDFIDSPVLAGELDRARFQAGDVEHEIVVHGKPNRPIETWVDDFRRIVDAEVEMFGETPLDRPYIFMVYLRAAGGGGLEHKNSSVMAFPRNELAKRKDYLRFLSLIAHEYFHHWNGKRMRPEAFEPFDYNTEIYTRSLWVVEGITSYYDELFLRRAGIATAAEYLEMEIGHLRKLYANPGRLLDSLEDASYDAWIKLYQRDEQSLNCSTSYYLKGQLVAMCLDLTLRHRSAGKVSLDDVMRRLWSEFKDSDGGPYVEGRVETIAAELLGQDCADFFEATVHSPGPIRWNEYLAPAGLRLVEEPSDGLDLGITLKKGKTVIDTVLDGGPGAAAGLSANDEILAINGEKVSGASFEKRLLDKSGDTGSPVMVTLFRDDLLTELEVKPTPKTRLELKKVDEPTDEQRALYEAWLREPWEGPAEVHGEGEDANAESSTS